MNNESLLNKNCIEVFKRSHKTTKVIIKSKNSRRRKLQCRVM